MIIKCKMCGGDIQFNPGDTYGQCEYCGGTSTIPKADDEQKLNRYNRANHFRRQGEFDKAITAYERILEEDDTDAEAHWGVVLSRYGIEYVEDPLTKKRIPTCHRVQLESILADPDYLATVDNATDAASRNLYEEQAKEIAEIQKGILAISANEEPYDVFICYKETDENGERTRDSALAQEIYYGLTEQGYKVFFSRITLEDKLGQQYEPYIFAALNSAKVMIVVGTKPEYFNAVWVRNEWIRFLHLMKNDRKKLLIPCYREMDPYDMPDELSNLQSQDMSKIGFMQDLLRGVRKVLEAEKAKSLPQQAVVLETGVQNAGNPIAPGVDSLLKRTYLFMEDGDFKSAADYLDRVLDIDPECSSAYAAKVCVAFGLRKEADLGKATFLFEDNLDWQKAVRFADSEQKSIYQNYIFQVKDRIQTQIRNYAYDCAVEMAVKPGAERSKLDFELSSYRDACNYSRGNRPDGSRRPSSSEYEMAFMNAISRNEPGEKTEQQLKTAADMFERINDPEARSCAAHCRDLAEQARQKLLYNWAITRREQSEGDPVGLEKAAEAFLSIPEYKDAKEQGRKCSQEAETIRASAYYDAVDAMKAAGNESSRWDNARKKLADSRLNGYKDVDELRRRADQQYEEALAGEKEARRQAEEAARRKAEAEARKKKRMILTGILAAVVVIAAIIIVTQVIIPGSRYQKAVSFRESGQYAEAVKIFTDLGGYKDATEQIKETTYQEAQSLMNAGDYNRAAAILINLKGYRDVDTLLKEDNNLAAAAARDAKLAPYKEVGSIVSFGTYPQTEAGTDQTPIEGIALDYDEVNHKALLLSKYGLDVKPYNTERTAITWEKCTLRSWLNGEFLNKAFSTAEQSAILITKVDNSKSQGYSVWDTDGGNNTEDRIFLLSYAEANRYLNVTYDDSKNLKSRVAPTAYALAQGARTSDNIKTEDSAAAVWWWLRSPGSHQDNAADVLAVGSLLYFHVNRDEGGVRPAFWLNLESDIF